MTEEDRIDPHHRSRRALLRFLGVSLVVLGLLFTVCGVASFFTSFGTFEPPRYFWCAFVGLPLLAVGAAICQFAYFGSVFRFFAGESAPVAKDTFNYMAEGTQEGVRTVAKAIREGLSGQEVQCPRCQQANAATANFCSNCGAALAGR
jgi:hypothetical protein